MEQKDNFYYLFNNKKELLGTFKIPETINLFMNCIPLNDNIFIFYNKSGWNEISFDYDISVYKLNHLN